MITQKSGTYRVLLIQRFAGVWWLVKLSVIPRFKESLGNLRDRVNIGWLCLVDACR